MKAEVQALVGDSVQLASLPAVVMRAVDLLNNPNASASDIGQVISEDPALSARLLKIVNSAFYGFPSRIETISRAITVVGTLELTDLILGSSAIRVFARIPNRLIDMEQFWEHSLYTGVVCRVLARHLRAPYTERCFVMGLLHDVGSLILYRYRPEQSRQALEMARSGGLPLHEAEQQVLGFDHAEVGAALMEAWRLPESFIETTRYHHHPSEAQQFRLETAAVHLADVITGVAHSTASGTHQASPLESGAWELTGLSVDIMDTVIAEADAQFEDARAAILPRGRAA